jgi:hypothetical protein
MIYMSHVWTLGEVPSNSIPFAPLVSKTKTPIAIYQYRLMEEINEQFICYCFVILRCCYGTVGVV